ncbi:tRNA (adenosine(37)-N6)-dimethylallyltransferase MiaA [Bacillus spizizenii ATCC 6633 = JCM 2499]|uniref:tRNA dimethylallyltransferase n=1 Tax=Bacillus spizizenii (strain ATCC 23059 / NRRL B-14472 / W23) TaxID=655816 RepID=E0TVQ3_BACSH|nr:tRNA (adenosine(37)-N6)-dimethylallyltransferase MiaA [Bacillus spizizenii]QCJ17039.1 tRNA (adenosine(37)-N6)-dimethylallyltransferase MiaA [Bacillus subtilis]ADM37829.1 tRNA delta(2)-isopentenylpyrophosphate transferase [Bacillus spizizenii str. W23]AJW87182.1 tRNA delta(2)-isopentenylpyrophosphate transferase [Bacillus spizizenii]EFG92827.1 tRNA delta(2)-isopentenylpyrophosphate transferase [Bacillus spizizenii ATCC 6633 = JCM 2499]KFK79658.1 tRNA dimethylallyltransferase [Bacillus spiziz
MNNTKQPVVILVGPTAVGKTNLSIQLAKSLNAEIISGDSMQVYKGMDIGTAKINEQEMEGVPHHLIDILDPQDSFSTADYQSLVRNKISEIAKRGKLPMIVGGTGLYIQSVLYDYTFTEEANDPAFRQSLQVAAVREGADFLHAKLAAADPEAAAAIHPNNTRRVIRALEILHTSGKTMSQHLQEQKRELVYNAVLIGLTMDRDTLYARINQRVDMMMEAGLLPEVKRLYDRNVRDCQSIQAIGYKELYAYFDGFVTLSDAVDQLKQNSRRYAKRQLTWFRNKMQVAWFDMTPPVDMELKKKEIFTHIAGKLEL